MENVIDTTQEVVEETDDGAVLALEEQGEMENTEQTLTTVVAEAGQPKLVTMSDGVQQYIVLANSLEEDGQAQVSEDADEPAAKRFRVEQDDGHTYVIALTGQEGNLQASLSKDEQEESGSESSKSSQEKGAEQSTDVSQAWFTTKEDKVALHSRGHEWKQGLWSKDEIAILQANIANYCREHNIPDPTEIIFEWSKDERKDFYRTVAKGLQRPLFSVYRRVIRMYDQKNHIGKYTPEELDKLKELRNKYGSDWATIGSLLGRSASSVKDRCRLMRETCNAGKWLPDEEKRLATAVYDYTGARPGESVTTGLSWASVAEKVGTRSEKQCRTKWLNYLNWKQKGGTEWTRDDDIQLAVKIAGLGVTDENQIDWSEIAEGWSSVRSPQWLRSKWWAMKRHIPAYQMLSFTDIAECVKQHFTSNVQRVKSQPKQRVSVLQNINLIQNAAYTVPVAVTADGTPVGTLATEEGSETQTFQTYEVLQNLGQTGVVTQTTQGAFLITQPQSNPAISFAPGGLTTDHIIVHALPVNQSEELKGNENVTVQMNNQPIIVNPTTVDGGSAIVQLGGTMGQGSQTIQLVPAHQITEGTEICDGTIITTQETIPSQTEIVTTESGTYEAHVIAAPDMTEEGSQTDLEVTHSEVTELSIETTGSPHYTQGTSADGGLIHMASLSDPMLTSDGGDLIGSSSDIEGEKTRHPDIEPDGETVVEAADEDSGS